VLQRSVLRFHGSDELHKVLVSYPAELADLDAAELMGSEKEVDLVTADVEDFGDFLDGVRLQMAHLLPKPALLVVTLCGCIRVVFSAPYVQARVRLRH
jgi:hypothetical protein